MNGVGRHGSRAPVLAALVVSAAVALVGACARPGAPPGGPKDRRPPVVVATEPDTFARVPDFKGPVVFSFDERISERVQGPGLNGTVVVSPRTGAVRVRHHRRRLEVEVAGGFQPGRVYRVTLLPSISDLFNNQLRDPFELVFSTGPDFTPTAVAGLVWDRITGKSVEPAEVLAYPVGDTIPQVAQVGDGGIYAFRYLPAGTYDVVAFQDRNRNGAPDPMETEGRTTVTLGRADTLLVDVGTLPGDTTPARMTRAVFLDSVTLQVSFDDYLDPASPASDVRAVLVRGDSVPPGRVPSVDHVFHETAFRALRQALKDSAAVLDSLMARDSTLELARPAVPPAPEGPPPPDRAERPDSSEAPRQTLIVVLGGALEAHMAHTLSLSGVVNVSGLEGGGGSVSLIWQPPPPDTATVDSARAVPDTAQASPDSVAIGPDTVPPDTMRVRPDTTRPDTTQARRFFARPGRGPFPRRR